MTDNQTNTTAMRLAEDDEIEIDLLALLRDLLSHWLTILAAAILGGVIAFCISRFAITPQFRSTSSMYIISKETTLSSLADLQMGSQLTQDYKVIVTSRPVLQAVVDKLGLPYSYKSLKGKLSIENPQNTRILSITAQDPDPAMACTIVDEVAETASQYIADIMELVPPKIIESGEVATQKSSPSNSRNALIGAVAFGFLICAYYCIIFMLNDTVVNEEDVTKYLGLSVLASVPFREGEAEILKAAEKKKKDGGKSRAKKKK
jgi:capsular polysaccharide biosynthesis protein